MLWNGQHYIAVWVTWRETPGAHLERGAATTQRSPWATWILLSAGINQSNLHMTEACPGWDWVRPAPSSKVKPSCKKLWCYYSLRSSTQSHFTAKVEEVTVQKSQTCLLSCALDSSAPAPKSHDKFSLEQRLGWHIRCKVGTTTEDKLFPCFHPTDWWQRQGQHLGFANY